LTYRVIFYFWNTKTVYDLKTAQILLQFYTVICVLVLQVATRASPYLSVGWQWCFSLPIPATEF